MFLLFTIFLIMLVLSGVVVVMARPVRRQLISLRRAWDSEKTL